MDAVARVRSKGQVTIPRAVREALEIEEGDEVVFQVEGDRATIARAALRTDVDDAFWRPPSPDEFIRASGVPPYVFHSPPDDRGREDVDAFLDSIFGDRGAA